MKKSSTEICSSSRKLRSFVLLRSSCLCSRHHGNKRVVLLVQTGSVWCGCSEVVSGWLQAEDHSAASPQESIQGTPMTLVPFDIVLVGNPSSWEMDLVLRHYSPCKPQGFVEGGIGVRRIWPLNLIEELQEHTVRYLSCSNWFLSPNFLIWSLFRCCCVVV